MLFASTLIAVSVCEMKAPCPMDSTDAGRLMVVSVQFQNARSSMDLRPLPRMSTAESLRQLTESVRAEARDSVAVDLGRNVDCKGVAPGAAISATLSSLKCGALLNVSARTLKGHAVAPQILGRDGV